MALQAWNSTGFIKLVKKKNAKQPPGNETKINYCRRAETVLTGKKNRDRDTQLIVHKSKLHFEKTLVKELLFSGVENLDFHTQTENKGSRANLTINAES